MVFVNINATMIIASSPCDTNTMHASHRQEGVLNLIPLTMGYEQFFQSLEACVHLCIILRPTIRLAYVEEE